MKDKEDVINSFASYYIPKEKSMKNHLDGVWNNGYEHGKADGYELGKAETLNDVCSQESYQAAMKANYKTGYDEGFRAGRNPVSMEKAVSYTDNALNTEEAYQRGYDKGLSDLWEAMIRGLELDSVERTKIWGNALMSDIIKNTYASEFVEKLHAHDGHDSLKSGGIRIGDEVVADKGTAKFYVTNLDNDCVSGIDAIGRTYCYLLREVDGKTGTFLRDVDDLLATLRVFK